MSKWTQLSREFLGDGDLKMSNEDALKLLDAIEADTDKIARLTKERDELRKTLKAIPRWIDGSDSFACINCGASSSWTEHKSPKAIQHKAHCWVDMVEKRLANTEQS